MTLTTEERDLLIRGLKSITGGCQSAEPLLAKLRSPDNTARKLEMIREMAQKFSGHKLMQVAGPFRQILNILKDTP